MSETNQENSFLNLSDEEMLNQLPPEQVETEVEQEDPTEQTTETEGNDGGVQEQKTTEEEVTKEQEEHSAKDDDTEAAADVSEDAGKEEQQQEPAKEDADALDYKAEYNRLLAPFKANGRDIAVKSVDDAITLMQMGANYNKKMAALKPNLKLLKMLENHGLLDEAKLSYLIDLDKKNPDAINKLMQESGLDPLDLDAEKAGAYKPSTYKVDDREVELDAVLDEIQESPSYNRTLDIVSRQWDGSSKQVIADTPQILKVINAHVQSGIYDLISQEVENERTFGRLQGLSDIEAYRQVGDKLHAQGKFAHLVAPEQTKPTAPVVVPPKPKMGNEDKLREKKRAASATKTVAATTGKTDYNPLSLSDEAFSDLVKSEYL